MKIPFSVTLAALVCAGSFARAQSIQSSLDGGKAAPMTSPAPEDGWKPKPALPNGDPDPETVNKLMDVYSTLPKSSTSMAERLKVDELVAPSYEEFLQAFGGVSEGGVVRFSPIQGGAAIKKYDLLLVMNLSDKARQAMRRYFSCRGRSGFEVLVSKHPKVAKVNLGVMYQCDGSCVGVAEESKFDEASWGRKTLGLSRTTDFPRPFCEALWSGKIQVEDKSGEREIY